jgi:hypothetical protein
MAFQSGETLEKRLENIGFMGILWDLYGILWDLMDFWGCEDDLGILWD